MNFEEWEKKHKILSCILYGSFGCISIFLVMITMTILVGIYKMLLEHEDILLYMAERMGI